MKHLIIALTFTWLAYGQQAQPQEGIFFLVDISGSMTALLPNIGRSIREQSDAPLLESASLGLISFAGCGKEHVHYLVPLAKNNAQAIKDGTNKLNAYGGTDLIAPLEFVRGLITKQITETGECANVILFTDNEDTCGNGNRHYAVLKEIQSMCANIAREFKLDIISSTVDEPTRLFLDGIAGVTGGKVHDAGTLDEIGTRIKTIVESRRKSVKGKPLTSKATKPEETKGGDKPGPTKPQPQAQKLPARQGKGEKKSEKGGGP